MRVVEFRGRLPKEAGEARLEFVPDTKAIPKREGDLIVLPRLIQSEFVPLMDGQQFLYWDEGPGCWFGGMDENPFLSHLDREALKTFLRNDEEGFYQALKPQEIKAFEKAFNVVAKRQGDFFFVESPLSFDAWKQIVEEVYRKRTWIWETKTYDGNLFSLLETRHQVTDGSMMQCGSSDEPHTFLVIGTIVAPDHKPLVLKAPHFVEQAVGFFDKETAKKAD